METLNPYFITIGILCALFLLLRRKSIKKIKSRDRGKFKINRKSQLDDSDLT